MASFVDSFVGIFVGSSRDSSGGLLVGSLLVIIVCFNTMVKCCIQRSSVTFVLVVGVWVRLWMQCKNH